MFKNDNLQMRILIFLEDRLIGALSPSIGLEKPQHQGIAAKKLGLNTLTASIKHFFFCLRASNRSSQQTEEIQKEGVIQPDDSVGAAP